MKFCRAVLLVTLALGFLGAPHAADAQQATKVHRIGVLSPASPPSGPAPSLEAFRQGLRELGYIEGQNILIEYRWAEHRFERLPRLAAELVHLKVDVIVALAAEAIRAPKQATRLIPIVMPISGDPVAAGLVASLARPAERFATRPWHYSEMGTSYRRTLSELWIKRAPQPGRQSAQDIAGSKWLELIEARPLDRRMAGA